LHLYARNPEPLRSESRNLEPVTVNEAHNTSWLPADFSHPTRVELPNGLHLRPLIATDLEFDEPALAQHPTAADSINYALFNDLETEILGSVSIAPLSIDSADVAADVSWWVIDRLVGHHVELELGGFVRAWLAASWPFDHVSYAPRTSSEQAEAEIHRASELLDDDFDFGPRNTPITEADHAVAAAFYDEYLEQHPDATPLTAVEAFGDSREMANELLGLVLRGIKTATASLVDEYVSEDEPLPPIGGYWVACDGDGTPRAILRTVELRVGPIDSVDDAFAFDEGENDRTRASWLEGHTRFWQRTTASAERPFTESSEVLFERFEVVWTSSSFPKVP